jgi:hypothetical protein
MGKLNRHSGQTREPPKDKFNSSCKYFCKFEKQKSGDQKPLKKRGVTEKPYE